MYNGSQEEIERVVFPTRRGAVPMTTHENILRMVLKPTERKSPEEVLYVAFQANDPRYQRVLDDGSTEPDGFQLDLLRKLLNGDEGDIPGSLNALYPVSLKPWANADAKALYLRIEVPAVSPHHFLQHPSPTTTGEAKRFELHREMKQAGKSDILSFLLSGRLITQGASLASWRKSFGGDEGEIEGPEGRTQRVSLASWTHLDPELTFVQFNWVQQP
jgi:hypothetical protein